MEIPSQRRHLFVCLSLLLAIEWAPFVAIAEPTVKEGPVAAVASGETPRLVLGRGAEGVAYVDESTCSDCHAGEARAFAPSHHARAMQEANADTVLGDFENATHTQDGETFRFFQRDGRYFVNAAGADGVMRDHPVLHTFGVDPLQQYLVPGEGGRLQALGVGWDSARRRWFDLDPEQAPPPGDAFHWTGRYQTWNVMCADCHSTDLRRAYDPVSDSYATTWSAPSVGCQACHGPGARHVAWAKAQVDRPGGARTAGGADAANRDRDDRGLVARHAMASARAEVDTCAPCHALRASIAGDTPLYETLLDDYLPQVLEEGLYHPDGQILGEVYVYGSFVQSRMYAAGVRCSDCHEPHGLGLRAEGNALCTRCHSEAPERDDLPGLRPGVYDAASHHHHEPGSEGAQCVACHMPSRTYMVVDPRRDHGLRVPRPDQSVTLGVPNACNGCHADRDASWSADHVREWFGPDRTRGPAHAAAIHDGRLGDPSAGAALAKLTRPGAAPDLVRATAVSLLPRLGPAGLDALVDALGDPDPLVRVRAVSALSALPGPERLPILAPLLDDDVRAVRAEAGRALADVPESVLTATQRASLAKAVAEYESGQRANADLPVARMNLALLHTARGRVADAEREYRTVIRQDPLFAPPVANLSQLLNASGRQAEAETALREGVSRMPEEGELFYSLGLLLAESGDLTKAVPALEEAARLLPDRPRVQYNLGLALQHLGRRDAAVDALERAARGDPASPDIARALAIACLQAERWPAARDAARRWIALSPRDPNARAVLAEAERGLAGAGSRSR